MNNNRILRGMAMAAAMSLAGGAMTTANAQSAPAPSMNVGDTWVYNVKSGIGLAKTTYQETREVIAVSGKGGKIKVTGKTADGKDFTRVEEFASPGALTSGALCFDEVYRFPTPLQRVSFPVAPGQRSSKWVDVIAEPGGTKGQINYFFRTRSWDKQTVPAGSFDAIRVDVLMVLDDSTPFRNCDQLQLHLLVLAGGAGTRCGSGARRSTRSSTRRRNTACSTSSTSSRASRPGSADRARPATPWWCHVRPESSEAANEIVANLRDCPSSLPRCGLRQRRHGGECAVRAGAASGASATSGSTT